MKVNRPGSPLSSGAEPLEPLDPRELQRTIKGEQFAAALSQLEAHAAGASGQPASGTASATRTALAQIASRADLASSEGAATAVRESARYMIRSRLSAKYRETKQGERLIEDLSEYVAGDPLLKTKLMTILKKVATG